MNKSMWHSELEELTEQHGGIWITLVKEPNPKSRKPDLAGFVTINDWEGRERYVNIENEAVFDALAAAPVGVPIQIRAGGMRENAWLEVAQVAENGDAPVKPAKPKPSASKPSPTPSGPNVQPAPPAPPLNGRSLVDIYWEAWLGAGEILTRHKDIQPETEDLTEAEWLDAQVRIATHFAIGYEQKDGRVPILPPEDEETDEAE